MTKIKTFFYLSAIAISPYLVSASSPTVIEQGELPSEFSQSGLETLNKTIGAVNVFLALLFVTSVLGLVFSGVKFLIAGGSESTLDSARKTGIASIVGLLLSLVGYVIINIIKHFIV